MPAKQLPGHLAAAFTVLVWGTTFVSTKVLLTGLGPFEILFLRFAIGFLALGLVLPQWPAWHGGKRELTFAAAGLSGICLYFLLENIALMKTQASNVGIIVSVAPFFTAFFARVARIRGESLDLTFLLGLLIALAGVFLIGYNGFRLGADPLGDLCAFAAAAVWGVYAVLTRAIMGFGLGIVTATRRIFLHGLAWMLPCFAFLDFRPGLATLFDPVFLANLLFLGLGASAACYATWNKAVAILGAVKTSAYIYAIPVIAVLTAFLVLGEPITLTSALGTVLALSGLFIAERGSRR